MGFHTQTSVRYYGRCDNCGRGSKDDALGSDEWRGAKKFPKLAKLLRAKGWKSKKTGMTAGHAHTPIFALVCPACIAALPSVLHAYRHHLDLPLQEQTPTDVAPAGLVWHLEDMSPRLGKKRGD